MIVRIFLTQGQVYSDLMELHSIFKKIKQTKNKTTKSAVRTLAVCRAYQTAFYQDWSCWRISQDPRGVLLLTKNRMGAGGTGMNTKRAGGGRSGGGKDWGRRGGREGAAINTLGYYLQLLLEWSPSPRRPGRGPGRASPGSGPARPRGRSGGSPAPGRRRGRARWGPAAPPA